MILILCLFLAFILLEESIYYFVNRYVFGPAKWENKLRNQVKKSKRMKLFSPFKGVSFFEKLFLVRKEK
ncbi:hypothetical protein J9303_16795 [Bacillaceae bacterium Marseille-Q3522]|nr:hypothetical protein [Bacillaceae bacterium Marseille-Q3522]